MSATDGYTDLPYSDYPAVDNDERYLYRDVQLDDIPYINNFESLFAAVKAAVDSSARLAAWNHLQDFISSTEYIEHVEPVLTTAMKFQRLEDCLLACQRFAKKQVQQWVVSDTEPESVSQAVGDIWFKTSGETNGVANYTMYRKTSSGYVEMSILSNDTTQKLINVENKIDTLITDIKAIKVVSSLPSDASSHLDTLYLIKE